MDQYLLILTGIGLASLSMAWMPRISAYTGISYAIFYVLIGFFFYVVFPTALPNPLPQKNPIVTLHLTELVVLISLMGTGIKIDRNFTIKNWASPLKLATFTMPICILAAAYLGYQYLELGLAAALLLGAVLAPTDPVLAADVQVGPPNDDTKSETKFALTAEAGLNDGMAFPFTWLAITVGLMSMGKPESIVNWFAFDVLYRIFAGIVLGYLAGKGMGYLIFEMAKKYKFLKTRDGLLAISLTLVVFGVTELVGGYGFIAVFITAISFRHYERNHAYHKELHSFTDQVERLLVCVLLLLFGGALASGILSNLDWKMTTFILIFLLLIRPLAGLLTLSKSSLKKEEKLAISIFGIKGFGSVFYLAFAISKFNFLHQDKMWAMVALAILVSVILHGFTASKIMSKLTKRI